MCQYRDTDSDRPETAHAVIDLKFASVREGRARIVDSVGIVVLLVKRCRDYRL